MRSARIEQFSRQFALERGTTFLNHAGTSPITRAAAAAMHDIVSEARRPMSEHLANWIGIIEQSRRQAANLLHADPDEFAFVPNTSCGLSLVAHMVPFAPGDAVLYDETDFPSNRFIWECVAKRKELGLTPIPYTHAPGRNLVESLQRLDLSRAKLLTLSAVSYYTGYRHDLREAGAFCRERGIYLCVDAIQAVGAVEVDLSALPDVSFLACGGQKWLHGPVGSGFIFVRKALLDRINMPMAGWASVDKAGHFNAEYVKWIEGAARFEAGLPDIAAIAGLGRNLELYNGFGIGAIAQRVHQRATTIFEALRHQPVRLLNPEHHHSGSGIVAFELDSRERAEALDAVLKEKKIIVTRRENYFRVSPHFHTTERAIVNTLDNIADFLGRSGAARRPCGERMHSDVQQNRVESKGIAAVIGASGGLGAGFAEGVAARGHDFLLSARDDKALEALCRRLRESYQVGIQRMVVDLTNMDTVDRLAEQLAANGCDFVAYAAAAASVAKVVDETGAAEQEAFTVNYFAPVKLARGVLPGMIERNRGRLLFIVTSGSRCSTPLFSSYAASKAALWAWAESLSRELHGTKVSATIGVPPHMSTATQQKLARTALRNFRIGHTNQMAYPSTVARELVDATLEGQPVCTSAGTRVKHALNALFPRFVQKRITANYHP